MKRVVFFIVLVLVGFSTFVYAGLNLNPKLAACEKSCVKSFEKCKKKAKGSSVKLTACETAKNDCIDKCQKKYK